MIEFNKEKNALPQIVQMTASVDLALNEIRNIFGLIADELVTCKYDIIDKEQQILKLQRPLASSLNISFQATKDHNHHKLHELELIEDEQNVTDDLLKNREAEISNLDAELKNQENFLNKNIKTNPGDDKFEQNSMFPRKETSFNSQFIDDHYISAPDATLIPTAGFYSPSATNISLLTNHLDTNDLKYSKSKYDNLEKKYYNDLNHCHNQIKYDKEYLSFLVLIKFN